MHQTKELLHSKRNNHQSEVTTNGMEENIWKINIQVYTCVCVCVCVCVCMCKELVLLTAKKKKKKSNFKMIRGAE